MISNNLAKKILSEDELKRQELRTKELLDKGGQREIIEHINHDKDSAWLKKIVLQFPNLLLDNRINYVISTSTFWQDDKFSLLFKEHKISGTILGVSDVHFNLTSSEIPSGWHEAVFTNIRVSIETTDQDPSRYALYLNDKRYWRTGEDWTNRKNGIYERKNWYDFLKEFKDLDKWVTFKKLVLWVPSTSIYSYCCPVAWKLDTDTGTKDKVTKKEKTE